MKSTVNNAKPAFTPRIGRFAMLARAGFDGRGSHRSFPAVVGFMAGGVVAVLLMLLTAAAPALAAAPPQFLRAPASEAVFATRAHVHAYMETGLEAEVGNGTWGVEYAPAEGGHSPPKGSGSWIPDGSGTLFEEGLQGTAETVGLGEFNGQQGDEVDDVHHLKPETVYFVRFHAEDSAGEGERTFEFRTTAVAEPEILNFNDVAHVSPTSTAFKARVESNGAQTGYSFEYSLPESGHAPAAGSSSWMPFTSGASGVVTVAEDFAEPEAKLTGLEPETTYYVRVKASNGKGEVLQTKFPAEPQDAESFTTSSAKPGVAVPAIRNVTLTSAYLTGGVDPRGSETYWRLEYSSEADGGYVPVPGAEGTISQAEAEALPVDSSISGVEGRLSGLDLATTYYVRLFAENHCAVGCGSGTSTVQSFETSGVPPAATTFATHALHGESLRLLGSINPNSIVTSAEQTITVNGAPTGGTFTLTFEGQSTAPIAFNATAEEVRVALEGIPSTSAFGDLEVSGRDGGPYTVFFGGAGGGVAQPEIETDASGLIPSGTSTVTVAVDQAGGEGLADTHYHFEYITEEAFKADGESFGAGTESTPEVDLGTGKANQEGRSETEFVGADLPGLKAGATYRYRLAATSTDPGNPVGRGAVQTLAVGVPVQPAVEGACPNQALRTGPSANLPDCRAYEQLTPVDKEGAQEAFSYFPVVSEGALVGTDGEHVELGNSTVNWGSGPDAGESPYFFSRSSTGWQMTSGSPQPQTGVSQFTGTVFAPGLTSFGFESAVHTSPGTGVSGRVEFEAGPPGGPYSVVASVGAKQTVKGSGGWVAASEDFSKLILEVSDRQLVEPPSTTKSGDDLYEYTGGELRQVNVQTNGSAIGACGAQIVRGVAEEPGLLSSPHAVSVEGSRVFFEAVPSKTDCSEPSNLYIREDGERTIDIGAYHFVAADRDGGEVLLEKSNGGASEFLLYDSETGAVTPLPGLTQHPQPGDSSLMVVSEDFNAIYLESNERLTPEAPPTGAGRNDLYRDLYRYDVAAKTLSFLAQVTSGRTNVTQLRVTPDGRYAYFEASVVSGLPGGGVFEQGEGPSVQVYRYDAAQNMVQCASCASSFDPEPRLQSTLGGSLGGSEEGHGYSANGLPRLTLFSADGDFVFFDTPAALVSSDVDGEVKPVVQGDGSGTGALEGEQSVSSDVYEWRGDGVDGCAQIQGCLALITNGRGGYQNLLLGTADEGRDVFISTDSQLGPNDHDTAGDIYDARIGGGFPEAAHPVECKGDSCSTPYTPPSDLTPSSSTFHGAGNLAPETTPAKKKAAAKKKTKKKSAKKKRKRKKANVKHAKNAGNKRKARS